MPEPTTAELVEQVRDERLARIYRCFEFVPLNLYDEITKLGEQAVGEFCAEAAALSERLEAAALQHEQDEKVILKRGQEIDRQLRRAEAAERRVEEVAGFVEEEALKREAAEREREAAEARVQELEQALRQISHYGTQYTPLVEIARAALEPPEPTA